MKNLKLIILFVLAMPFAMQASNEDIKKNIETQIYQLEQMLSECNNAYINNSIPMYKQSLTFDWYLNYYFLFRLLEDEYTYNSEVLLTESKKLADIIATLEKLQESNIDYNEQVNQLIDMLINSNNAYMQNIPMYKQDLSFQWCLNYFIPFRLIQSGHCYNSEILLTESKKLADIILVMAKLRNNQ